MSLDRRIGKLSASAAEALGCSDVAIQPPMSKGGDNTSSFVKLKVEFLPLPELVDVKDLMKPFDNARLFCLQKTDCILFAPEKWSAARRVGLLALKP